MRRNADHEPGAPDPWADRHTAAAGEECRREDLERLRSSGSMSPILELQQLQMAQQCQQQQQTWQQQQQQMAQHQLQHTLQQQQQVTAAFPSSGSGMLSGLSSSRDEQQPSRFGRWSLPGL